MKELRAVVNSQTANQIDVVGYDGSAATALNLRSGGASGAGIKIDTSNDVFMGNDLALNSDGAVMTFGANEEISLTHVHNRGINFKNTLNQKRFTSI